jgi:hypothetical protein
LASYRQPIAALGFHHGFQKGDFGEALLQVGRTKARKIARELDKRLDAIKEE